MIPFGYEIVELNRRVPGVNPDLLTRFKWRAERRARYLNKIRQAPIYRWEVNDSDYGKWAVVAMMNQLRKMR